MNKLELQIEKIKVSFYSEKKIGRFGCPLLYVIASFKMGFLFREIIRKEWAMFSISEFEDQANDEQYQKLFKLAQKYAKLTVFN
jgi:hypothetical protein